MHFNKKWFWIFWLNSCISVYQCVDHNRKMREREAYDNMTGAEIWERNMRGY